jgi:LacI family transcriptional regulator
MASRIWPPLTTVRLPIREMGKAAAALLIQPVREDRTEPVAFEPEIIVRQSTAPLPKK